VINTEEREARKQNKFFYSAPSESKDIFIIEVSPVFSRLSPSETKDAH
jgi:hypothetical protein